MNIKEISIGSLFLLNSLLIKNSMSVFREDIQQSLELSSGQFSISSILSATVYSVSQFFIGIMLSMSPKKYIIACTLVTAFSSLCLAYCRNFITFLLVRIILYMALAGANVVFMFISVNYVQRKIISKVQSFVKMITAIIVFIFFNNSLVKQSGYMWQVLFSIFAGIMLICSIGFLFIEYPKKHYSTKRESLTQNISNGLVWYLAIALGSICIGSTFIQDGYLSYFDNNFSTFCISLITLLYPVLGVLLNFLEKFVSGIDVIIFINVCHIFVCIFTGLYFTKITAIIFTISCSACFATTSSINYIISNNFNKKLAGIYCSLISAVQVFISSSLGAQVINSCIVHTWKYHGTCNSQGKPIFSNFDLKYSFVIIVATSVISLLIFVFCKYVYNESL